MKQDELTTMIKKSSPAEIAESGFKIPEKPKTQTETETKIKELSENFDFFRSYMSMSYQLVSNQEELTYDLKRKLSKIKSDLKKANIKLEKLEKIHSEKEKVYRKLCTRQINDADFMKMVS